MENLWPNMSEINDIKSTENVLPFFEDVKKELFTNFSGKIKAELSPIVFVMKKLRGMASFMENMEALTAPISEEVKYEELKDIEKGRKIVNVNGNNYKFEIYNDHLYYKLFTILIPEFYPLKLSAAAGTLEEEGKEVSIENLDELKNVFVKIVNSNKVKMIIKKML